MPVYPVAQDKVPEVPAAMRVAVPTSVTMCVVADGRRQELAADKKYTVIGILRGSVTTCKQSVFAFTICDHNSCSDADTSIGIGHHN